MQAVHEIQLGVIKAAIWENEASVGVWHNVSVIRLYKDGNEWRATKVVRSG